MARDDLFRHVHRRIDELTAAERGAGEPIDVLVVGERTVWIVVDPEALAGEDVMLDVFSAVADIPGVRNLYVGRPEAT